MTRKKRTGVIVAGLLVLLIGLPCGLVYRQVQAQVEQARKDQALIAAIKIGDNEKILKALAEGASGEARDNETPPTFKEALLHLIGHFRRPGALPSGHASYIGHPTALLLLYNKAYLSAGAMPEERHDPGPDLAIVRELINHGARVNDRDDDGWSPLKYAAEFSNSDIVRLLLSRGADLEAKTPDKDTPLMNASATSTRVLLEYGANIEARGGQNDTPLTAAAMNGKTEVVRILLEHGANIEAMSDFQTPLISAADSDAPYVVRLLLELGAKVTPKDDEGHTALDIVRHRPDPDSQKIAALLRKYGAK